MWELAGRRAELAYLHDVLADPARAGAVIAGQAGVGKTRLLRETVGALEDDRFVITATGTESARSLPFGALSHLLPEGLGGERPDLLSVIAGEIGRRATGRRVLLAIDDAHLLDVLSAAFVLHVATTTTTQVVVTIRSGEDAPDAVLALHRDEIVPRLELQPISRSEFDGLLEGVLDGPVETLTLDRMWKVAVGNVLYVRELLFDALQAGTLRQERGVWRWSGGVGPAPRLREVVAARFGHVTGADRRLLDVLAVGEPLDPDDLEALAPGASVVEAERRGLVALAATGRGAQVRLAHPLFGEALRAALPALERRALYRQLVERLERVATPADVVQLALWREEAGLPRDGDMLTEAARRANQLSDHELAARLAGAAIAGGAGFAAALERGEALGGLARFAEAESVLRALIGQERDDADRERVVDQLVRAVAYGLGRTDDGLELLLDAERRVQDPAVRAFVKGHRATLLTFAARFAEGAAVAKETLAEVDDDAVKLRSLTSVGIDLAMAGRLDEAIALTDEGLDRALRLHDTVPRGPLWFVSIRATALLFEARFAEVRDLFDFGVAAVGSVPPHVQGFISVSLGRGALSEGKPATARRLLIDAAAAVRGYEVDFPASWCLSLLAEAHATLGDVDAADAAAAEACQRVSSSHLAYEVDSRRARAWVDVASGRLGAAVAELIDAADSAAARGQRVFEMLALHDALRLGERSVAPRLADLAAAIDGPGPKAVALHAAARTGADLDEAAAAFGVVGMELIQAEALAAASVQHDRDGLRARASAAGRQSRAALDRCEGARTPALDQLAAPVRLSRREREVAELAARGASNAEIAAQLVLSVRTVESHLYSAYGKLGITDRAEIAETLVPSALQ